MQDPVFIRSYTQADRDWLTERHQTLYRDAEGFDDSFGLLVGRILDTFAADHDPKREAGWIAQSGTVRLGSIFCVRHDARTAKLRLFLLTPEARGQGIGARLLAGCMNFAREAGYDGMQLWTHESHKAACALYRRTGWTLQTSHPVHSFGVDLVEQTWTFRF